MSAMRFLGLFVAIAICCPSAVAQLPTPDLSRLNPPAARAGDSLNVALYGSNLDELTELRFTHVGIKSERVTKPGDEFFPEPRPQGSSFIVTVAPDVPPGIYEARGVSYLGISTARPFVVASADSNEVAETGDHATRDKAMPIDVNSVVSGSVPSRGIDWYRFTAKAGQRVLLEIHAERIDSRMDGQLIVYDSNGREVDRNRDRYGRDPFLEVSADQDAEYFLAVSDILYRGGAEHFYRLSISDRPHIDFVFPPAGLPGSNQTYTLFGRNLPGGSPADGVVLKGKPLESLQVQIELPDVATTPPGHQSGQPRQGLMRGFDYRYEKSNKVRIGFATAPVVAEQDDIDIQPVSVPTEIAGRFDEADDEDIYRFTARKGTTYCAEVIADRMASNVDPYVIVHRATRSDDGVEMLTQVADNDDLPSFFRVDGKDSINVDTSDAAVSFTAEDDGEYQVTIINQFGSGGPADLYRLAIREPVPDFDVLATFERPLPTGRTGYSVTPLLRQGATAGLRILVPRQDGFEGDIVVTAEDLPPGVTARPLTLSGKTDRGVLVLSATTDAKSWAGDIRIVGRASVDGRELVREARFATLVWGHIFADSIRVRSRLTERVPLAVNQHEQAPVALQSTDDKEWTVEVGQKLEIPIKVTDNGTRVGGLTVEPYALFGLYRGAPTVNVAEDAGEGKLTIDFKPNGNFKVQPGRYQFALHGTGVTKYRRNVAAVTRAESEVERIEKLLADLTAEADRAKVAADETRAALDKARKDLATATPETKAGLEAAVAKAQSALGTAEKAAQAAADKVTKAEAARKTVDAALKSATSSAGEKNTSFAVWSDLITVKVTRPAKK